LAILGAETAYAALLKTARSSETLSFELQQPKRPNGSKLTGLEPHAK
jgi:hypothetical protein